MGEADTRILFIRAFHVTGIEGYVNAHLFCSQDKIAESVSKMANVLDQPMSSQQRQSLATSLMGSIGAVLESSGSSSSDGEQSANDTSSDTVNAVALIDFMRIKPCSIRIYFLVIGLHG